MNYKLIPIILFLFLFNIGSVLAQVTADFSLPAQVCLEEQFQLDNNSVNTVSYEWDFCPNDIESIPSIETGVQSLGITFNSFKLIESNANYYGFGITGSNIYRLDYGNSINNVPAVVNLGNLGLLNSAQGIDIYKEGSKWVGFVGHFLNGGGYIVRLVWDDLETLPTADNIGNLGVSSRIPDVKIIEESGQYYVFFPYYNGSSLIRLSLGNSLENTVEAANTNNITGLTDVQFPIGLDAIEFKGSKFIIFASTSSKTLSAFEFDTDWGSPLGFVKSEQYAALGNLRKIKLYKADKAYAFLSNTSATALLDLNQVTAVDDFALQTGLGLPIGNGIDVVADSGRVQLFSSNSNQLDRSKFENECSSSIAYSEEFEPVISFSSSGAFPVELTAIDANSNRSRVTKSTTVTNNQSPSGQIVLAPFYCITDNISFDFTSTDDISTYLWDFGDGNTSTSASSTHQYASAGEYYVSLLVEDISGCTNTFYDTLNILAEPTAEFTTTQSEYCTFEAVQFTNATTPTAYGENVSWSWDFNGEGSSTLENPSFTFETAGPKTITLEANVLGCIDSYQSTITIIEGPEVAFEYDKNCLGESIQFTNLSTGVNITGYLWDFGNGQTSTAENPQNTYTNVGTYPVSLTVSNNNGCDNILTQNISIFEQVVDSIMATQAIENLPFKMGVDWNNSFDSTQNISYQWDIAGAVQTSDTASYTLAQGSYTANLEVTTVLGCVFTAQRMIEVQASASPTPDFSLAVEVCLEEQIAVDNISVNASSYQWDFCPNDIESIPSVVTGVQNLGVTFNSFKLIEANSKYYGFGVASSNVYRLEYGSSTENVPSVVNLGDFGLLNSAQGIDIAKEGNKWVGFVGHFLNGGGYIVRLVWSDLETVPTAENIGNLGVPARVPDVKITEENGAYHVFFTYYNGSSLVRVSLGNSLENAVDGSNTEIITGLTDVQFPTGLDAIEYNGSKFIVFASTLTKTLAAFEFDTDWGSTLGFVKSQQYAALGNLRKIKLYKADKAYAFLSNVNKAELIDLNQLTVADNFAIQSGLDLPIGNGIDFIADSGRVQLFSSNSNQLDRSTFENQCSVSTAYSEEFEPVISFSSSGAFPVELTAIDANSNRSRVTKSTTVTNNQSPSGQIVLAPFYCITDNISFDFTSTDDISTYLWDFGDGNTSTSASSTHQYASAGEYYVSLLVEDISGCTNTFYDTLNILAEPTAEFTTTQSEYCTFEAVQFTNATTPTAYGENVSWSWDFNGEGSSTLENPSFTFETAGPKTITLEANVLGCIDSYQSTITIIEGPEVAFEYDKNCLGESIQFTNLSTGVNITGYLWDFGNGQTSTAENPQNTYTNVGTYPVSLTVSNNNGCDNILTQNISIFEQVVDSIMATQAIENLPFKMGVDWNNSFDSTQNISYQWDIAGAVQTSDTASYTLAQGSYTANLEVTTVLGCVFTAQRMIEVQASASPTPDFSLAVEVCLEEQIAVDNISVNASSYQWDFCPNDIESIPSVVTGVQNLGVTFNSFKLIEANSKYYGFGVASSNVYRLEYGSSTENVPSVVNLGDFGLLNSAQGIDIAKEGNKWVGFVGHFLNGGGYIVRLVWSDLETVPTAENIGNLGVPARVPDVKITEENGAYHVFFTYYNGSSLVRVSLGNSLENAVDGSNTEIITGLTDVQFPTGLDAIEYNGSKFIVFASTLTKTLAAFEFDTDWGSTLGFVKSQQYAALGNLRKIKLYKADKAYAFLSNVNKAELIDLNQLTVADNFAIQSGLDLPIGNGIDFIADSGRVQLFSSNSNQLERSTFENQCSVSTAYSEEFEPVISFSSSGAFPVELTAIDANSNRSRVTKSTTVTNNQSPEINFITGENFCSTNHIQFESQSSAEITSFQWDFGDGESSTETNPEHLFSSAGTYIVQLSVTDTAGCNNLIRDTVRVYAEPVPDFQATAQGSLCSQKPLVFENLTDLPTTATFLWDFGDGNTSTDENPEHIYANEGEYIINLQIEMAGCLVEKTDTISVNPGPLVDFNYSDDCFGQVVNFENISTGDFLQRFQWNFGDGTQSSQSNPNHSYDSAGTYLVQLTALTSNGCDFAFQKEVEVSPVASVAFEAEVGCAEQPVQFTEQVALDQSNITDYLWDFGISGTNSDVSTLANPQFTFPVAGTYQVRLQVTTADGCTSTGTQSVSVNALPQPAFTYERNCLFNPILFSPENTNNIIAHFWELQNEAGEVLFTAQSENFSYAFEIPGNYQLRYRQQNESLCSNSVTQNVEILPLPEPDFQVGNICAGEAVFFENLTDLKGNTLKNYSWSIDGEIISSDLQPEYTFEDSGEYLLSLQVETQSGCIQSISKPIIVSPTPIALFELEQTLVAYPYTLSLSADEYELSSIEYHEGTENRGQGTQTADRTNPVSTLGTKGLLGSKQLNLSTRQLAKVLTYVWTLNEDTISTTADLNYTIEEAGTYLLGLMVTNEAGCTDSYYKQIRIREPNLDIALNNLRITQDQDFTGFVLNISNRGTLVPERLDLDIDLGSYSVTETIEQPLLPENNRNVALSIKLTAEQLRGLAKICIRAVPHNAAASESNVNNNRVCTNLESGLNIMDIYPNPVGTQFTLPIIIPENGSVNLSLEQSNGQSVKTFKYDLEAGYNEIHIDRDNLRPGMYFLRIRFQGEEKVKKIIFQ